MNNVELCHNKKRLSSWAAIVGGFALFATACHPGAPVIKTSAVSVDGTIAGIVHASDNAIALNGRQVRAVNLDTGATYETTTGLNGGYSMKVPEGTYRLEVETRDGEKLARQPEQTRVDSGDLDEGRNFDLVVTTTAHP